MYVTSNGQSMASSKRQELSLTGLAYSCSITGLFAALRTLRYLCDEPQMVILILLLYVDDIILTGDNSELLTSFIDVLSTEFRMKDLGPLHYFLGIEACHGFDGLYLTQSKYARDLLCRSGMESCKTTATPMAVCTKRLLKTDDAPYPDPSHYRRLVGALQCLTLARPDLAFSVNFACQFMQHPTMSHFQAVKRILRYVRGTQSILAFVFHKIVLRFIWFFRC